MKQRILSILLALCMVLSLAPMAAFADVTQPGTRTYTVSYDSSTGYSLNGSDGSRYTIGKTLTDNISTFTAQMNDVTITVTAASGSIYFADTNGYQGFEQRDYTFSFTSSTYIISNVKLRKITQDRVMNVDNNSRQCAIEWDHNTYNSVQQIEVTLIASTFNVNYVLNGGVNAASNADTYSNDQGMTLAAPTRAGYAFDGWYANANFTGSAITEIPAGSEGDRTFYAKWVNEIEGVNYDEENGWFVIDSAAALNALSAYAQSHTCEGKTFRQTADIALSGSFTPIGKYENGKKFQGTYDGGGHVITGLSVSTEYGSAGMFICVYYGTVKNVVLINPTIAAATTGNNGNAGGMVGYAQENGNFINCYVVNPTLSHYQYYKGAIAGDGSTAFGNSYTGCYFYSNDPNDGLRGVGNSSDTTGWRFYKLTSNTDHVTAASDGTKLTYGGASYITQGSSVTLTITPEKGYILTGLTVNGTDVTDSVSNNTYTFNMPATDVTVTASFVQEAFTYVDLNGNTQTIVAERITSDSAVGLYSGWYAVDRDVTRDSGFNLVAGGDGVFINIILYDGVTLNLPSSTINTAGGGKPNLVIWGQEHSTGTLKCISIPNQVASVTVNGGKLQCGVSNYNCAINGNLTVNRGEVHLTPGFNTCVNGNVTFNGGILESGKISGNTTLNWTANTDRVKASEYVGSVTVADGKYFKDGNGNFYCGALTAEQKNAIKNVELQPAPNAHTVTVGSIENGAVTADKAVAETGSTVTLTIAPAVGYQLASLMVTGTNGAVSVSGTGDTRTFVMPDENVTVTAEMAICTYTITYNGVEDATFTAANPTGYTVQSEDITLVNPTREGYTFDGWTGTDVNEPSTEVTIAKGSTGDRTYTANWTAHSYIVCFDANEGSGSMDNQGFTYGEAQALTANGFTRTGYHFTGWNTKADGNGTPSTDGQTVQNLTAEDGATVTLYAQWTANTYTVHFVINNESAGGTMEDQTFTYDEPAKALTANAFYMTTGEFLDWNTESDGSGTDYADKQVVQNLTDEDGAVITLYAQWRQMYRIQYDDGVFTCVDLNRQNEFYWAYPGDTVEVRINNSSSVYTIAVTGDDGTDIAFDESTNTFTMPNQQVWITSTSVKIIAYTTILLDSFESYEDVSYLYDAEHPIVTPVVTVMDGETTLIEGTDYTLEIKNNTGSPDEMVEATVIVTGMGGYIGTNTKTFRITPFNIANCELKGKLEAYDDGYGPYYPLTENVQVWDGETQLTLDTDYSIDIVYPESGEFEVGQTYQATIKGQGKWGGTKTFTFTFVELYHTVVFDANGGTGTMADDKVANSDGSRYYLPECSFTAPAGKAFSHWVVSVEPDEEKQPGDYFTAPYIWSPSDVLTITVTAVWKDREQPKFASHSLVLSGEIGVNFFMDLSGLSDAEKEASYMTLAISGKGTVPSGNVPYNAEFMSKTGGYYGFTCHVNSIQMADTITATFHYGDHQTVSETYSVKQYIESFDAAMKAARDKGETPPYDETTENLVHALADYGHYVQPFLSAARGWTTGDGDDQYAEMDAVYAKSYDVDVIKTAVAEYAIKRDYSADIEKVTYSLLMDSDTAIYLYFKPVADYDGSFTVEGYTATKQSDGRYLVIIPNIGAHKLGDAYTVVATTANGNTIVTVSALSYVNGVLTAEAYQSNTTAQYAVAAIYAYYDAAIEYKRAHP